MTANRKISIIIRTLNEEKHIGELIKVLLKQRIDRDIEILIVDSGSTDRTLSIINEFEPIQLIQIPKSLFTYGYALNIGLSHANGDLIVSISGHCIPQCDDWLNQLVSPFVDQKVGIVYGKQIAGDRNQLSERRVFEAIFPSSPHQMTHKIFSHNANAAFRKSLWEQYRFDEKLLGLEDLDFAYKIFDMGYHSVYAPQALVSHFHQETKRQIFNRYYREMVSLGKINPALVKGKLKIITGFFRNFFLDCYIALREKNLRKQFIKCLEYRFCQYYGEYSATLFLNAEKNMLYTDRQ